jgi:hypothetical protein
MHAVAQVEDLVRRTRGLVGADALAHRVAGVSRRAAAAIKTETRMAMERERRAGCRSVAVSAPGIVRGFDQLWVPTTCGLRPVLVSADACVPYRTSLVVADRYDSRSVARAIDEDFREHGAPLVWRADRASCHRTDEVEEVLRGWDVLRLHGPAHLALLLRAARTTEPRAPRLARLVCRSLARRARRDVRAHAPRVERSLAEA